MTAVGIRVEFMGPLFLSQNSAWLIDRHLNAAVQEVAERGEMHLDNMLRPRPAGVFLGVEQAGRRASTGHYRRNIQSARRDRTVVITDGGVIYGPWLEGIGSRNATTRFKGYASFRRVTQRLREKDAPEVVEKHVRRLVAELGGG